MRFMFRSALLCLTGASLRYHSMGRLACRMEPCVASVLPISIILWDLTSSGHYSDRLLPRDLFISLQTPARPRHIPAAAASPRHDVRMARGVAVDGDSRIRLITMPRAPRMLVHGAECWVATWSVMPSKESGPAFCAPKLAGQVREPSSTQPCRYHAPLWHYAPVKSIV
jgi:hypothetical protein